MIIFKQITYYSIITKIMLSNNQILWSTIVANIRFNNNVKKLIIHHLKCWLNIVSILILIISASVTIKIIQWLIEMLLRL